MTVGEKWFIFYAIGSILYYLSIIFLAIGTNFSDLKKEISEDLAILIFIPIMIIFIIIFGLFSYISFIFICFTGDLKPEKQLSITRISKALPFLPVVLLLGLFLL